jgi:hypothetical protein
MGMRTITATLAGLTLFVTVGCGETDENRRGPEAAPDRARVACGAEGRTRVLTPVAEARNDGLHLEVTNEGDREAHLTVERDSSGGAGVAAPPGTSEHVLAVGPGHWKVTCYEVGPVASATFELLDTGIWVSTEIDDCETPESSHGDPPRKVADDRSELPELARRGLEDITGLEPGYEVEPAGYPQQEEAIFRARRDGQTIGTMSFYPDGEGGWLEGSATACADSGPTDSGEVEG